MWNLGLSIPQEILTDLTRSNTVWSLVRHQKHVYWANSIHCLKERSDLVPNRDGSAVLKRRLVKSIMKPTTWYAASIWCRIRRNQHKKISERLSEEGISQNVGRWCKRNVRSKPTQKWKLISNRQTVIKLIVTSFRCSLVRKDISNVCVYCRVNNLGQ